MSRYRTERLHENLPHIALDSINHDGVAFTAGPWRGDIGKALDHPYLKCGIRITTKRMDDYNQVNEPCWSIRLDRKRVMRNGRRVLQASFEATITFNPDGIKQTANPDMKLVLMRGTCRTWEEAIEALSWAPITPMIRRIAAEQYRGKWAPIRPFSVTYPWTSWAEPNAQYSPFRFKGEAFHPECEGAIGSALDLDIATSRKIASDLGANAFLLGPFPVSTPSGTVDEYRLYHRDTMRSYDVIDLDAWYARIVAGAGD